MTQDPPSTLEGARATVRSVTGEGFGLCESGYGGSAQVPLATHLAGRLGVGERGIGLFGGRGDVAVSGTVLGVLGRRRVVAEGGAGVVLWPDGGPRGAPHVSSAVQLRSPVGRPVSGGRPFNRDLLLRIGLVAYGDPSSSFTESFEALGLPVYVLPSFGAGLAF